MSVLELEDAKAYLKLTTDDASRDEKLQEIIDAAEAAIAARIGGLEVGDELTARVAGGSGTLLLPTVPVDEVVSVTPVLGAALDLDDLYINTAAGVITYNSGAWFGDDWFDIVYAAGRASLPADIMLAVKELVRHLWTTQRGAGVPTGSPVSEAPANTIPGAERLFPYRVEQLLAPHVVPGIA